MFPWWTAREMRIMIGTPVPGKGDIRMKQIHGLWALLLLVPTSASAAPELAPTPRIAETHVWLDTIKGGYQISLSASAAANLRNALDLVGDGKSYTDIARAAVKNLNDPEAERKLDLMAFVLRTQAPALKKAIEEKTGINGVVIKVFGIENKKFKNPRPVLWSIGAGFIPPEIRGQIETGAVVVNTIPLIWRVEERK